MKFSSNGVRWAALLALTTVWSCLLSGCGRTGTVPEKARSTAQTNSTNVQGAPQEELSPVTSSAQVATPSASSTQLKTASQRQAPVSAGRTTSHRLCSQAGQQPTAVSSNSGRTSSLETTAASGASSAIRPAGFTQPAPPTKEQTPKEKAASLLLEIMQIKLSPLPKVSDPDVLKRERRLRNLKIVDLAGYAATLTHNDPKLERLFSSAVRYLLEARLELALQGDLESADALYRYADALFERDPSSRAAAEAGYTLVKFVQKKAEQVDSKQVEWLREFAKQARLFAKRFPTQKGRATLALFEAGQWCELHGLLEEAKACYGQLETDFADSPQAKQLVGVLRRLNLPGSSLTLAGPTLDGKFLDVQQFVGHPVLVVLWSTTSQSFVEKLPLLLEVTRQFQPKGLRVVSVAFDAQAEPVRSFVQKNQLPWPVVFYGEKKEAGWNNPIAEYYGIWYVPQLWLVRADGRVASVHADWYTLKKQIQELLPK